jgi:fibro-slime domain-containing protein
MKLPLAPSAFALLVLAAPLAAPSIIAGCSSDASTASGDESAGLGGASGAAAGAAGQGGTAGGGAGGSKAGGAQGGAAGQGGGGPGGTGGVSGQGGSGAKGGSAGQGGGGPAGQGGGPAGQGGGPAGQGGGPAGQGGGPAGQGGGPAGQGGQGGCVTGATQSCGVCNRGTSTCASGVFGECVLPTPAPSIVLAATIRDHHSFNLTDGPNPLGIHVDFNNAAGDDRGIVAPQLGPDKKPVYANPGGTTATTHGKSFFDQWYNDVPGVNQGMQLDLKLDLQGASPPTYSYSNQDFFPIDNLLLGNEGFAHNYSFTVELHTSFLYQGGETFSFAGDDDVFVFLNNQLAIDLGGVHVTEGASIELDKIASQFGMTTCNNYDFTLFYNERHATGSDLTLTTTIALTGKP